MTDEPRLPLDTPAQPASGRPKRPMKSDADILFAAALEIAKRMTAKDLLEGDPNEAAGEIAKCGIGQSDGFKIARDLEYLYHWECDFECAEALDDLWSTVDDHVARAQVKWVTENGIVPPLASGARVRMRGGGSGIVDTIDDRARYLVAIDGDPRAAPPSLSRRIVNFEDVEVME